MKKKLLIASLSLAICFGQELGVGDTVPSNFGLPWCANNETENDSLFLHDYNGATNGAGQHSVIWLMIFTSWCPYCETEAPVTQEFLEIYQDSGLVVIGMGMQWGSPYYCDEWAEAYGLTYPILDDDGDLEDDEDSEGWNLFADCCVPHNVVIDHNMEIVYTLAGFPDDGEPIFNAITAALDDCGVPCLPGCSGVSGDIDGTYSIDNGPIINVMDLLKLSDIIADESQIDDCLAVTGDLTGDGAVNIIDIYAFASMLTDGTFDN